MVTELRFSIFDLRHHVAEHRLSGALAEYVREVSHGTDLRVHLLLDESGPPLPSWTESELLRVAQEAIGNVRKHAQATNLWVTLASDGSGDHPQDRGRRRRQRRAPRAALGTADHDRTRRAHRRPPHHHPPTGRRHRRPAVFH